MKFHIQTSTKKKIQSIFTVHIWYYKHIFLMNSKTPAQRSVLMTSTASDGKILFPSEPPLGPTRRSSSPDLIHAR